MSISQFYAEQAKQTEAQLKIVSERLGAFNRQIEPLKTEVEICEAAVITLSKRLARYKLEELDLNGHEVEFTSNYAGPSIRRMLVSGADMQDGKLHLSGKVYTTRGGLSKGDWYVPVSGARDLGKPKP